MTENVMLKIRKKFFEIPNNGLNILFHISFLMKQYRLDNIHAFYYPRNDFKDILFISCQWTY